MLSKSDQILNFLHTNVQILSNWIVCGTIQQFIYSNIQNFFFQILSENEKRQNVCDTMLLTVSKVKRLLQGQWRNCVYWEGTWMPTIPDVGSFRQGVPPTWFFYSIGILITNLQSDPFERLKNILTIYRIYSTPFIQILVLFISGLTMPDYGRFNS